MPARPKSTARILPTPKPGEPFPSYLHHGGYRFVTVAADGTKVPSETFPTAALAAEARENDQRVIDGVTDVIIAEALVGYEAYLKSDDKEDGPNRPGSIYQTMRKLATMFPDDTLMVEALTPAKCEALYTDLRTRNAPRTKRPYAAAYHRLALSEARTFLGWCVAQKYLATNPLAGVKGRGRINKRKNQLRIDQARLWLKAAHHQARDGQQGAVAAMMAMLMGLRASEITNRLVMDVDDDCSRLHVTAVVNTAGAVTWEPKTDGSDGILDIPPELQGYIREVHGGRPQHEPLWTRTYTKRRSVQLHGAGPVAVEHWRGWVRGWVLRICKLAGVARVTAHDMRRLYGTVAYMGGAREAEQRAQAGLRHTEWTTSDGHYVAGEAQQRLGQAAALAVLKGGK